MKHTHSSHPRVHVFLDPFVSAIDTALHRAERQLAHFAHSKHFDDKMKLAFGDAIDVHALRNAWRAHDFSSLPKIEVRTGAELHGAEGAFAATTQLIYLSKEFLIENAHHPKAIAGVLLEEIGHWVDTRLNNHDSPGDEGAIFSALVQGKSLSPEQLAAMKAENDSATVSLDGQSVAIEQASIVGTDGNDVLSGTSGDDTIDGLAGNDTIQGLEGNDSLIGGNGDDVLSGGDGVDTLLGGAGNDYLDVGTGKSTVDGGEGADRAVYNYASATANLSATYTTLAGGTISDGSTLKNVEAINITGGSGNDTLNFAATTYGNGVDGGAGDDTITGGLGDYDRLLGGAGNDVIRGGAGNDNATYFNYDYRGYAYGGLYGGDGNDAIYGEGGNDYLEGDAGDDNLDGGEGDDVLSGGDGVDTLLGGAGNDYLDVGTGKSTVDGGEGADRAVYNYASATANLSATYTTLAGGTISDGSTLKNVEAINITGGSGNDTLNFAATTYGNGVDGGAGDDTITGGLGDYDRLLGGAGNDVIRGGAGNDNATYFNYDYRGYAYGGLYGGDGNDAIYGEGGNDYLEGDAGDDNLDGGEGDDVLSGGDGVDTLLGGAGNDYLDVGTGKSTVDGGEGADRAVYNYASATANLSATYTTLAGGTISDGSTLKNVEAINITGGSGNDTLNFAATTYGNGVDGGAGDDTITGGLGDYDRLLGGAGNDVIRGGAGNDNATYFNYDYRGYAYGGLYGGDGNDAIYGEGGNDYLEGDAGDDNLDGGEGDDVLSGGDGVDTLLGGAGNDYLDVGTGKSTVDGGEGADRAVYNYASATANLSATYTTLAGGTISDGSTLKNVEAINITGGSGNDTLNFAATTYGNGVDGGAGDDTITGGLGDYDRLLGGAGNDVIRGGAGNDNATYFNYDYRGYAYGGLYGGDGNDAIYGEGGNDYLEGDAGDDNLDGGEGDDVLSGGDGVDTLLGGAGNDYLDVGTGKSTVDGGEGADRAVYNYASATANLSATYTTLAGGTISDGSTLKNVEAINITGGSGNDTLNFAATTYGNGVDGGAGDDTITGGLGDYDRLLGGAGNDVIRGGAGNDNATYFNYDYRGYAYGGLYGGDGNDAIYGEGGNDYLEGDAGDDNLDGGEGDDVLSGGDGVDTLLGGAGNDYLDVGTGKSTVDGGEGADRAVYNYASATANLSATYTTLAGGTISDGSTLKNVEAINITGGSGNDTLNFAATTYGNGVDGGAGDDTITGGLGDYDRLLGGAGNDVIRGGAGNDNATYFNYDYRGYAYGGLYGGDGNDAIYGEGGNDYLEGDAGDDNLDGVEPGSLTPGLGEIDTLVGGTGSDRFILGDSANVFYDNRDTANNGGNDYALITDLVAAEDKVQLQGAASDYLLAVSGNNTNLYLDKAGSEPDELIAVFQNVTGLDLASSTFQYVLPASQIAFSNATFSGSEGGPDSITLTRTGSPTGTASVTVNLTNGTATAPADYASTPIVVNFAAGETTKTVAIPVVDDTRHEPDETINLALTNPSSGVSIGAQSAAVFTIHDNDAAQPGTLAFTVSSFSINENGTPVQAVTISRTGGSDGAVSAILTLSDGTAHAPDDYNGSPIVVNFADGQTSQNVTIPVVDDSLDEPNETINLTLTDPTGGATLGTQATATVTINDNDLPLLPELAIGPANLSHLEGDIGSTDFSFTVTRSGNLSLASSVTYAVTGSGTDPADAADFGGTLPSGTVSFAVGEAAKTITIKVHGDTTVEPDEGFAVTLSQPNNATIATVTSGGTIQNDDRATDTDGDGIPDSGDNAILVSNPNQRDTDGDGYGNVADPDLDQNHLVDAVDLSLFISRFGTADANADFDGTGLVDAVDLSVLLDYFGKAPGPSYIDNLPGVAEILMPDGGNSTAGSMDALLNAVGASAATTLTASSIATDSSAVTAVDPSLSAALNGLLPLKMDLEPAIAM